jgi:hypothetical protein
MKNPQNSTFFDRIYNPFLQGGAILTFVALIMILLKGLQISDNMDVSPYAFWVAIGTGMLVFALFNSIISLSIPSDMNAYWTRSTGTYIVLTVLGGSLAWFFSSMTIGEAGSFRWIFMVVTFGYLLFLSLMRFIKKVVFLAQQEDNRWMNRRK